MKLIKFKTLSKEELLNELKPYIPTDGYLYFSYPTNDEGTFINNGYQLELFIDEHKDEYWFADAIGYRITEENKLEFMWDADTHNRVITERKEYYDKKAEFIAKWGCE